METYGWILQDIAGQVQNILCWQVFFCEGKRVREKGCQIGKPGRKTEFAPGRSPGIFLKKLVRIQAMQSWYSIEDTWLSSFAAVKNGQVWGWSCQYRERGFSKICDRVSVLIFPRRNKSSEICVLRSEAQKQAVTSPFGKMPIDFFTQRHSVV